MNEPGKPSYRFGPFLLSAAEQRLTRDGTEVELTRKAFEVLLILVREGGRVVEKKNLLQEVWPDTFVGDNILAVNVRALRKALGDEKGSPKYIETVPRVGYRFAAEVIPVGPESMGGVTDVLPPPPPPEPAGPDGAPPAASSLRPASRYRLATLLACALIVASAVTAGVMTLRGRPGRIQSIAVLPLINDGGPETEYLADGITENIINDLSRLPGLKVIARPTMFHYKGRVNDPLQVGRELGVGAVLTGRVTQQGEAVAVQIDLIDVASGREIWGDKFNRELSDIVAVQTDVANRVGESLQVKITGAEPDRRARVSTTSHEAYILYLKGRYFWNSREPEGIHKAIEYFNLTLEKDPAYAPAYAGLADCYNVLQWYDDPPKDAEPRARAAATKALELDESLAEAHTSLAFVKSAYDWDWAGAEQEYRRAIELNPNYATAHQWYGLLLVETGRYGEAVAEIERARDLDPLSISINKNAGAVYYYARQYDKALAQFEKTLELSPGHADLHNWLTLVHGSRGEYREALEESAVAGTVFAPAAHEPAPDAAGSNDLEARYRELFRRQLKYYLTRQGSSDVNPVDIAGCYAMLGEVDSSVVWLNRAYEERNANLIDIKVSPVYDSLRGDPRFLDLLRRMNLQ